MTWLGRGSKAMAKFVLIDDSKFILSATSKFLSAEGHEVVACGRDGEEGVELVKAHKPDLILLDLTMPNADGRECLRNIRDNDPQARVLVVSAIRDKEIITECLEAGAKGYIEKPMRFRRPEFRDEFLAKIQEALAA